jgi:hypothetical protein
MLRAAHVNSAMFRALTCGDGLALTCSVGAAKVDRTRDPPRREDSTEGSQQKSGGAASPAGTGDNGPTWWVTGAGTCFGARR